MICWVTAIGEGGDGTIDCSIIWKQPREVGRPHNAENNWGFYGGGCIQEGRENARGSVRNLVEGQWRGESFSPMLLPFLRF